VDAFYEGHHLPDNGSDFLVGQERTAVVPWLWSPHDRVATLDRDNGVVTRNPGCHAAFQIASVLGYL